MQKLNKIKIKLCRQNLILLNYKFKTTYHDTICGNNGVNTKHVRANQTVANKIPTKAPQKTCANV